MFRIAAGGLLSMLILAGAVACGQSRTKQKLIIHTPAGKPSPQGPTAGPPPVPNPISKALAKYGLDLCDIHVAPVDVERFTDNAMPHAIVKFLYNEPLQAKNQAQLLREALLSRGLLVGRGKRKKVIPSRMAVYLSTMSRLNDRITRRMLLGDPIAKARDKGRTDSGLVDSIKALYQHCGQRLPEQQLQRLSSRAEVVPHKLAQHAATIIYVMIDFLGYRDRAVEGIDPKILKLEGMELYKRLEFGPENQFASDRKLLKDFDAVALYAGAQELSLAVEQAGVELAGEKFGSFDFEFDTPIGRIALHGEGTHRYAADVDYLLIIDTAGNDVYATGGGACGNKRPVSVLLDLTGNDTYRADTHARAPKQQKAIYEDEGELKGPFDPNRRINRQQDVPAVFGCGVLGCGILLDMAGDDNYYAQDGAMGYARFGVGVLADFAGNDKYDCFANCQGSAYNGLGLLVDLAGNDRYFCYTFGQGMGFLRGVGVLVDDTGNDVYTAEDSDISLPSAQSKQHNASLSQGMGLGFRADFRGTASIPGGIGIIVDGAGDDEYSAGVFAQGAGYWQGAGFLIDAGGDDKYHGAWYVQGASAHFGVGVLLDETGNDKYESTISASQGLGHDIGVGALLDLSGDDTYVSPGLSMGAGNAAGCGIFIDVAGNDNYTSPVGAPYAHASKSRGARRDMPCIGLFIDAGGKDSYPNPKRFTYLGDNKTWSFGLSGINPQPVPRYSIGIDAELTPGQLHWLFFRHGR